MKPNLQNFPTRAVILGNSVRYGGTQHEAQSCIVMLVQKRYKKRGGVLKAPKSRLHPIDAGYHVHETSASGKRCGRMRAAKKNIAMV